MKIGVSAPQVVYKVVVRKFICCHLWAWSCGPTIGGVEALDGAKQGRRHATGQSKWVKQAHEQPHNTPYALVWGPYPIWKNLTLLGPTLAFCTLIGALGRGEGVAAPRGVHPSIPTSKGGLHFAGDPLQLYMNVRWMG